MHFIAKLRHRTGLPSKTAGCRPQNQISVEVPEFNLHTDWISLQNADTNRISLENVNTDWVSSTNPQVSSHEIEFVSRFRRQTSTQIGFPQQNPGQLLPNRIRVEVSRKNVDTNEASCQNVDKSWVSRRNVDIECISPAPGQFRRWRNPIRVDVPVPIIRTD